MVVVFDPGCGCGLSYTVDNITLVVVVVAVVAVARALLVFDSVVSVHEDIERHGRHGMSAVEQCVVPSALKRCFVFNVSGSRL